MKTCSKCRECKPLEAFPPCSRNKRAPDSWCRICRAAVARAHGAANREAQRERSRRWRSEHGTAYRQAHREPERQRQRLYRQKNAERKNAANRRYREKNRGRRQPKPPSAARRAYQNAYCMFRKANKLRATPRWADMSNVRAIYAEAQRRRELGEDVHVDHIVPLKSDVVCGLHWEANLQILGAKENVAKRNRWWPDMAGELRKVG